MPLIPQEVVIAERDKLVNMMNDTRFESEADIRWRKLDTLQQETTLKKVIDSLNLEQDPETSDELNVCIQFVTLLCEEIRSLFSPPRRKRVERRLLKTAVLRSAAQAGDLPVSCTADLGTALPTEKCNT